MITFHSIPYEPGWDTFSNCGKIYSEQNISPYSMVFKIWISNWIKRQVSNLRNMIKMKTKEVKTGKQTKIWTKLKSGLNGWRVKLVRKPTDGEPAQTASKVQVICCLHKMGFQKTKCAVSRRERFPLAWNFQKGVGLVRGEWKGKVGLCHLTRT